jgi:hypothetical protein
MPSCPPSCQSSGDGDNSRGGGGERRRCRPGVVIDRSSARREQGGEPPSLSSAVVGVTPLQQHGGVFWAEAAVHDALEGCILALKVGNVLLQALKEELLAQAPGCGCARASSCAGPGTSAAHRGGRWMPPPPTYWMVGGGRQAQDGGNVHRAGSPRPRRPPLLPPPLSPPPLSLSALHSTPRQDCSTIVQVFDGGGGGGAPMENLRIPLVT